MLFGYTYIYTAHFFLFNDKLRTYCGFNYSLRFITRFTVGLWLICWIK